jgi:hypothetical protein
VTLSTVRSSSRKSARSSDGDSIRRSTSAMGRRHRATTANWTTTQPMTVCVETAPLTAATTSVAVASPNTR